MPDKSRKAEQARPVGDAPALEASAVTVFYAGAKAASAPSERAPALRDVTLRVTPGEMVAVLGPNGAGKTTLLRVLAGTRVADRGVARLFGDDLAKLTRPEIAKRLAVVTQSERVAFGYRVREVVMMGRAPHQAGWLTARPEDEAIVLEVLDACGLLPLADRRADTLSGGEQKRMQIARALAQRPKVLLLDEPSAFLDVRHQIAVHDLLRRRVTEDGLACVVVMHDLALAARYATRVALLAEGELVALGTPDEVLVAERLRAAFDVDIEVGVHAPTGARFFLTGH